MRFYTVRPPQSASFEDREGGIEVMPEEGFSVGSAPQCPKCGRFLGMLEWLPPYRLEIDTWGRHYGDIARTGDDLIVSDRFVTAFQEMHLLGIEQFVPTVVTRIRHRRGRPQDAAPRYFKASVVRSQTTVDQCASGYAWADESRVCGECLFDTLERYSRIIIDLNTWSGEDVFFPRGGHGPIVSERFKSMCDAHRLLGVVFIPSDSDEAGYDSFPWKRKAK